MSNQERTRTVTWQDPLVGAKAALKMSGLQFIQAMINGEFPPPPISQLMGYDLLEVEAGRAVFGCLPAEYHYNPMGSVHGGLAATLLDSALGLAVYSALEAGTGYTTVQLNIHLVRAMTVDTGYVRVESRVLHVGRKLATAEATIIDKQGKLYAHGSTTCMVFSLAGL